MYKNFRNLQYVIVIIILQLYRRATSQEHSLFDHESKARSELTNVLEAGIGILKFLNQGEEYQHRQLPDTVPKNKATYDFVIVGAGTAGSVIAARLSEIPDITVLLIEAGPHENLIMDIPVLAHLLQLSNEINWKYRTKPSNKYCLGMKDNSCNWPRGKVVGGSSVLNYMIATRGATEDYDRWAKMGNDGWAYKDVLEYFKKIETVDIPRFDKTYRGTEGPLYISQSLFHTPLAEAFVKAGEELGYSGKIDYNRKDTIGFSYLQNTIMNGTRMSSNRAYLHPARNRRNLHLTIESKVRKLLIDRKTKRTFGVEFTKYGQRISVFARREVILCAGAIGSPQLLMLSGIGPRQHLTQLGIDVIRDAPVGENLMDHISFCGLTWQVNAQLSISMLDLINPTLPFLKDYLTTRLGPYEVPGGCEALAFIHTKNSTARNVIPDIELLFTSALPMDIVNPITMGFKTPILEQWRKYRGHYGWTILPMLLKPKSRGRIKLLANDVNVKPEIVPNYFDDPDDVSTMIAGIEAAMRVSRTKTMQAYHPRLLSDIIPGCENYEYNSYAYWECAVRTMSCTIYHYSGTCKMGPKNDKTAIVDPKLKVIGIDRLRIADASIMPEIVAAHTNIPVYMIAEKLADIIKEEWGYLKSRS